MRLRDVSLAGALLCGRVRTEVVTCDVAVIGGGAAGTYTAIQLQKLGRSVVLVERLAQLGGNVNTYVDPATRETYDVGVVAYENIPVVTEYLRYLDVPFTQARDTTSAPPRQVDFRTGSPVNLSQVTGAGFTAALRAYQTQLDRYPYLINGYDLPSELPADFFLSWGEFIEKYRLQDLAYVVSTYNQGVGNILDQPTFYVFKYLNAGELNQLLTGVAVRTAAGDNQHIYDAARTKLGPSAWVSSNVTSVRRSARGVRVVVSTPDGKRTIHARQLVVAVRPTLGALRPFLDLRSDESALFARWNTSYYWCGLVARTGLPKNVSIENAASSSPYNIPSSPGLYSIGATTLTNNLHTVYYSSPYKRPDRIVQSEILATVGRVRQGLGYATPEDEPEIVYWRNHQPFFLRVSEDDFRGGYYSRLEGLQGRYRTYWTGAAWQTEDSSAIWNYTRAVTIPRVMNALANGE